MSDETPSPFDQALLSFGELVAAFGPDEDELVADVEDAGRMSVERVTLDLPVEIEVAIGEAGDVRLGSAPPTQRLATTIMPVMHRLRMRIVRSEGHAE
jgi:hypothetical protein